MLRIRLVTVVSYPGKTTQSLGPRLEGQLPEDLEGHHVLLVDDILDTGNTLSRLREDIAAFEPASLRIAVLLDKPSRRETDVTADFAGHEIPDLFVVGYGLDLDGRYRNLPQILALQAEGSDAGASDTALGKVRAQSSSSSIGAGSVTKSRQPAADDGA